VKKYVRFNALPDECFLVESHPESWDSAVDLRERANQLYEEVQQARQSGPIDGVNLCVRGLEDFMSLELLQERRRKQRAIWMALLEEQDNQRRSSHENAEQLGNILRNASLEALEKALERGKMDALEVLDER